MKKLWLMPALAALVVASVTAGQAQAGPDIGVQDVLFCDGGPQEKVFVRTDSSTTVIAENAGGNWLPVPGMVVNFSVPNGDIDHALMQFSADASLDTPNFPAAKPTDSIMLTILVNGVPQEPLLLDHTFNTDTGQSNMVQACRRFGPGNYQVTVEYLVVDTAPLVMNLTGELDGKALHVQISD